MMTAIMLVRSVVVVVVVAVVLVLVVVVVRVMMMPPGGKWIYQSLPAFGTCGHFGLS